MKNLNKNILQQIQKIRRRTKMQKHIALFHFFRWSEHYGWQHLGATDGYDSYEKCRKDQEFTINNGDKYKIMKLVSANPPKRECRE